MKCRTVTLFALSVGFICSSCTFPLWKEAYYGDGVFQDEGATAATDRYVLSFPPFTTTTRGTHVFHIGELPRSEFTIGLRAKDDAPFVSSRSFQGRETVPRPRSPRIRFQLADDQTADVVIDEAGYLSDWRGSGLFLYRDGMDVPVRLDGDSVTHERAGVRASHGWGTRFTPQRDHTYTLTVSVEEITKEDWKPSVVLRSGGWK